MSGDVVKVFTPIKRVPTMIGKAPNGRRIPFGPYTLPQVAVGTVLLLVTAVAAVSLPVNPAVVAIVGLVITVVSVFAMGLVAYTGVRLTSRILWIGRLFVQRAPASASAMPVGPDAPRDIVYIDASDVILLPDVVPARPVANFAVVHQAPTLRELEGAG